MNLFLFFSFLFVEEAFLNRSLLSKFIYIYCATWVARFKYYYAWIIGEVISNVSGLGFAGYDPKTGQQNWELMSNIDIWKFEVINLSSISFQYDFSY